MQNVIEPDNENDQDRKHILYHDREKSRTIDKKESQ
jgi:hypothetical protein